MIAIGCDHGGYELKQEIMKHLEERGLEYKDYGTYSSASVDYPEFAKKVALAVAGGDADKGILICGTGIGISITANKVKGIRCALCHDVFSAKATREHNNANILAMGGRIVGPGLATMIVDTFLDTPFSNDERHIRRINMIEEPLKKEGVSKIGIIGAMQVEVDDLVKKMENASSEKIAGVTYHTGKLCGVDVVIARSGIGKVNAAIAATVMAQHFKVTAIINTGIAGSLSNELNIGDIVLSTDCLEHDMDATGFGYKRGVIPQMADSDFKASEKLIEAAKKAASEVLSSINVKAGRVVSGDQFISDDAKKKELKELFDPMCTEMEGAAIAHAAAVNGVEFLIVRAISDKADGSANMDYEKFEKLAVENSVKLMTAMLSKLAD